MNRVVRVAGLLATTVAGFGVASSAHAANSVWEAVRELESILPLSEGKIARTLLLPLTKVQQGGSDAFVYRATAWKVGEDVVVDELVWTPRRGKTPSTVVLNFPDAAARSKGCLTRAEVSREYGAPSRSWTSDEAGIAYTHFEFVRSGSTVSVAFGDVAHCLGTLTFKEAR